MPVIETRESTLEALYFAYAASNVLDAVINQVAKRSHCALSASSLVIDLPLVVEAYKFCPGTP